MYCAQSYTIYRLKVAWFSCVILRRTKIAKRQEWVRSCVVMWCVDVICFSTLSFIIYFLQIKNVVARAHRTSMADTNVFIRCWEYVHHCFVFIAGKHWINEQIYANYQPQRRRWDGTTVRNNKQTNKQMKGQDRLCFPLIRLCYVVCTIHALSCTKTHTRTTKKKIKNEMGKNERTRRTNA